MSDAALDRDLYCLQCGYNLRGLSGDPVRCPECAYMNPIGDVEIPAPEIRKQIRKMETSPALCVAAVLLGVPLNAGFALLLLDAVRTGSGNWPAYVWVGCAAEMAPLVWIFSAWRFRASCLRRPGWGAALIAYHWWGLLLIVSCIGGAAGAIYLFGQSVGRIRRLFPAAEALVAVVGLSVVAVLIVFWAKWGYRLATARFQQLQREVAVRIARERIRKEMARRQRGLFR